MSQNYFFSGYFNDSKINAINKIKANKTPESKETIKGNLDSFVNDLNTYSKNQNIEVNNSDLFKYIEQVSGMQYFKAMLDTNQDGKISNEEAEKLAQYTGKDGKNNLTSKDVDAFINDIKNTAGVIKETKSKGKITKYLYGTNASGELIKKRVMVYDAKTNKLACEYIYNYNGLLTIKKDQINNTLTMYDYKDGVKTGATVSDLKTGNIAYKYTYNPDGIINTKEDAAKNTLTSYSYNNGKVTSAEVRDIKTNRIKNKYEYDANEKIISKQTYSYNSDETIKSIKDTVKNTLTKFSYKNGVKTNETIKDIITGKVTSKIEYYYDKKGNLFRTRENKYDASGNQTGYADKSYNNKYTTTITVNNEDKTEVHEGFQDGKLFLYEEQKDGKYVYSASYDPETGTKTNEKIYDENGEVISDTYWKGWAGGKVDGNIIDFRYEHTKDKDGNKILTTYDGNRDIKEQTINTKDGKTVKLTYKHTKDKNGKKISTAYDSKGQVAYITTYNKKGNPTTIEDKINNTKTTIYYNNGIRCSENFEDKKNKTSIFTYYYKDGTTKKQETIHNNNNTSNTNYYYSDGTLQGEYFLDKNNNTEYAVSYYTNGTKEAERYTDKNSNTETKISYGTNGVKQEEIYTDRKNNITTTTKYYNDGITKKKEITKNNIEYTTTTRIYDETGKMINETFAAQGCNGEIDEHTKQGKIGDCWLISAVLALNSTQAGKAILKDAIQTNLNGSVNVTFKGAGVSYTISEEEIRKHNTNDKNDKYSAFSKGDSDMFVMEVATERLTEDIKKGKIELADEDITESLKFGIRNGGYSSHLIYALTGKTAEYVGCEYYGDGMWIRTSGLEGEEEIIEDLEYMLDATKTNECAMNFELYGKQSASLIDGRTYTIDLGDIGHAFAFTAINEDRTVTFVNPWDSEKEYTMSFEEFAKLDANNITCLKL